MTKSYDRDDGFTLDLRNWPPAWQEPPRLDSWTANDSPLEHWSMATWYCRNLGTKAEQTACTDVAWADHLNACATCSRAESEKRIKEFARALRAEREAAA